MPMLVFAIYNNFSFVIFEAIDQVVTDKKDRNRMVYFKIYCDALCQYWRCTMIHRFVIFDVIDQVVTTKKIEIQFQLIYSIMKCLAYLVRFMIEKFSEDLPCLSNIVYKEFYFSSCMNMGERSPFPLNSQLFCYL